MEGRTRLLTIHFVKEKKKKKKKMSGVCTFAKSFHNILPSLFPGFLCVTGERSPFCMPHIKLEAKHRSFFMLLAPEVWVFLICFLAIRRIIDQNDY